MVDYGELVKATYELDKEVIIFTRKYKRKLADRNEFMKFFKEIFKLNDLRIAENRRLWKLALKEYRRK